MEVLTEMPFLAARYERNRSEEGVTELDRLNINRELINEARESHWKNNRDELSGSQLRVMNKFARKQLGLQK